MMPSSLDRLVRSIEILLIGVEMNVNRKSINPIGSMITIRQVKAARALLGWSQSDLAVRSGISEPTIARLESLDGELGGRANTAEKIRAALESAGLEFLDENGAGLGVRFRKSRRSKRK